MRAGESGLTGGKSWRIVDVEFAYKVAYQVPMHAGVGQSYTYTQSSTRPARTFKPSAVSCCARHRPCVVVAAMSDLA